MRVAVNIDRLVLDGVELTHAERAELPAAVQSELARLLTSGLVRPSHDAASPSPATRIGTEIAAAVGAALPAARRAR